MKKIIFGLIAAFGISNFSYAQLSLEHSYNTSSAGGTDRYYFAFNTENGLNHFTYEKSTNTIFIYNENHTLTSSFVAPIPANFSIGNVLFITDKLFNNDNLIEFLISVWYSDGTTSYQKILLFNNNGILLQEFDDRYNAGIYKSSNGIFKLIIKKNTSDPSDPQGQGFGYILDVYALPGTLSVNQQSLLSKPIFGYPNPTANDIMITNNLENGENARLEVFDTTGKKVLEKNVVGEDGALNLDVSNLSSGVYIYKLKGETNRFIKK